MPKRPSVIRLFGGGRAEFAWRWRRLRFGLVHESGFESTGVARSGSVFEARLY